MPDVLAGPFAPYERPMNLRLKTPPLSKPRIWAAISIEAITDILQIALGPLGWAMIDEGLDLVAMIAISWLIGFHTLLLPTFVLESIPFIDMLPGWLASIVGVVALRKRSQSAVRMTKNVSPLQE